MEPDLENQLRELEAATARESTPDEPSTSGIVPLREGWIALVRLLDEADRDAVMPELQFTAELPSAPNREPSRMNRLWGLAALAAGLLVVASAGWFLAGGLGTPAEDGIVQQAQPVESAAGRDEYGVSDRQAPRSIDDGWDDELDDRLADLSQQIASLHGGGQWLDTSLYWLDERMEQLQEKTDEL